MNWRTSLGLATLFLVLVAGPGRSETPLDVVLPPLAKLGAPLEVVLPPLILTQAQPKDEKPPKQEPQPKVQPPAEPQMPRDLFSQAEPQGPSDSSSSGAGHPYMVGDLNGGGFVLRTFTFPTTVSVLVTSGSEAPQQFNVPGTITRQYAIPLAAVGSFKIGENESPVPRNRVYATYNYFGNVATIPTNRDVPTFSTASLPIYSGSTVSLLGFTPSPSLSNYNVQRETFGIEKLFFGNDFSLSIRVPYIQQLGAPTLASSQIGDISLLAKYAFINNRDTGNVFSGGLMLTLPTGQELFNQAGQNLNTPLLQPWLGYFVNVGDFFFQGFSSVIVPTAERNVSLLANDFAVGYRFYRNNDPSALVNFVFPAVEGHLTDPLNHRGVLSGPLGFPDIFVTTAALYIGLANRSTLTLAAATPLTGPQPFNIEGIVQFNFFY